jgi:X-Pro dipeptidyl-peptidase
MNAQAGLTRGRTRGRGDTTRTKFVSAAAIAVAFTIVAALGVMAPPARAQATGPVFVDGQAQPVFSMNPATWIRHELWVESEIDSDFDGKLDRIHIDVSRVQETEGSRSRSSSR